MFVINWFVSDSKEVPYIV